MAIEVVNPGSTDDPFTAGASPAATDGASTTPAASGGPAVAAAEGQPAGTVDPAATTSEAAAATATPPPTAEPEESGELTEEEQAALDIWFNRRVEAEVLPKVQSSYDRRIAQTQAQLKAAQDAAGAREKELLAQVREAQLNGLTDAEKDRLRSQWSVEDEQRKLEAYEQQLEQYHKDILVAQYCTEYASLGLQPEDFVEFETPEQMATFVSLVELEYYKALANAKPGATEAPAAQPPAAAVTPAPDPTPAGATAPTDAGGGSAVPTVAKFNTGTGRQSMAENIGSGWETVRIA